MADAAWNRAEAQKVYKAWDELMVRIKDEVEVPNTISDEDYHGLMVGMGMLMGKLFAILDILRSGRE